MLQLIINYHETIKHLTGLVFTNSLNELNKYAL